jgi:choline dehydrogenase-like flavoprotein
MPGERYDAIVVGSGATGGWAAKDLAEAGLRIALVEAGPLICGEGKVPPARGAPERQLVQANCFAFNEATAPFFVDDVDNPYSHPPEKPFQWIRSRQVGGRMPLWGRVCLRVSDHELKAASRDGIGENWPISYADLEPHYTRVERFLGVCGSPEGLLSVPDGAFLEPLPLSYGELAFRRAVEERWPTRRVIPARIASASPEAAVLAAMRTRRLSLYADAVVARVLLEPGGGQARGVAYVERESGREAELEADAVFLCASTIESTRLLLNSAADEHPDGLGNSSGVLGRYLMDHTYGIGIDGLAAPSPRGSEDRYSHGCYVPSFRDVTEQGAGFARGYGIELKINPTEHSALMRLRNRGRLYGGFFYIGAFGEVLPNPDNRVTIDPDTVDAWGIPVAHIDCAYGENERTMAADQLESLLAIAQAAGLDVHEVHAELAPPGLSVHEMGTARMGADPESSVLDPDNRVWDVPNVIVTDGSCFVSSGFQNPTLTMMAITARACERFLERRRRGEGSD